MNLRPRQREDPEINLINMIDVLLVLLIFFMVSTTFNPEGRVSFYCSSSHNPTQEVRRQVIRDISKISDLPLKTIEGYRKYGWTDEEIIENLNDAIDFLNSHLHCDELVAEIPPCSIFCDCR
jgi:biopolymer transport protein ExbD